MKRNVTPHKGGRTVKRSTDVTPDIDAMLHRLYAAGVSLGDIIETAVREEYGRLLEREAEAVREYQVATIASALAVPSEYFAGEVTK